eukprot:GHVS01027186.1.p1 GENE.GHVS01027186.1~~GHVS01027186.1.p1  ORF type:complete len:224 (-),score=81.03 GHVS01027186.1:135-773(-)
MAPSVGCQTSSSHSPSSPSPSSPSPSSPSPSSPSSSSPSSSSSSSSCCGCSGGGGCVDQSGNTAAMVAVKPVCVELQSGVTYWYCRCGRSQNKPFCDGSHKGTSFKPIKIVPTETKSYSICQCYHSSTLPYCDGTHRDAATLRAYVDQLTEQTQQLRRRICSLNMRWVVISALCFVTGAAAVGMARTTEGVAAATANVALGATAVSKSAGGL